MQLLCSLTLYLIYDLHQPAGFLLSQEDRVPRIPRNYLRQFVLFYLELEFVLFEGSFLDEAIQQLPFAAELLIVEMQLEVLVFCHSQPLISIFRKC